VSVVPPRDRAPRRRSIAVRLAVALAAIIAVLGVVSAACLWALVDIHQRLHAVKQDEEKARAIVRLASAIRDQYAHVAHTIILGNDSHADLFRRSSHDLDALSATVRAQAGLPGAAARVDGILVASKEIERLFETQVLPRVRAGDSAGLVAQHDRILHLAFQAQGAADQLAKLAEAAMDDLNRHVRATQHGAILVTMVAHGLALITAVLVGVYLYRSIARPIATLSGAAERIGGGDLETEISVEREDELGQLAHQLNQMARSVKEHQAEVLRTEKLAGLGRVAAGIAHELNNPIAVILGYAKLLRRRGDVGDPKMLAAMEEEAERCRQVVDGLLELTRGNVLQKRTLALRPLVEDVVRALQVARETPAVEVQISGDGTLSADETKLRQVLTNVIANAIEASGATGRVLVAIASVSPGALEVRVQDSGPGVPAAARERIFEPFFTTKPSGTGLGLAISRAIVKAHGGDLVLSDDGAPGATFTLTLPITPPEFA
jgi:two-component system NtrC family sensor kinase